MTRIRHLYSMNRNKLPKLEIKHLKMETQEALKEKIERMLEFVSEECGFDITKLAEMERTGNITFRGTFSQYETQTLLRTAVGAYIEGEYFASAYKLNEFFRDYIRKHGFDYTPESMRQYADTLCKVANHIGTCDDMLTTWRMGIGTELLNSGMFKDVEVKFTPYDLLNLKKSIDGRYFHLYRYRTGGEIPRTSKFKIADGIVASDSLSGIITNTGESDMWGVTFGLFIERKIDLSYFVITFSINGNVFVLTDRMELCNPDQIDRLRGGGRRFSEDRERSLDFLPYILIDKVIEKRSGSNAITTADGHEVWLFPLDKYFSHMAYFIIGYTIGRIYENPQTKSLVGDNTAAIGDGRVDMTDNEVFSKIGADKMEALIDELYSEKDNSIVPVTGDLVPEIGMSMSIMTHSELDRHFKYLAHKRVAERHEAAKWGGKPQGDYEEYKRQRGELMEMFAEKRGQLLKYLFAGDKVAIHDIDHPNAFLGFGNEQSSRARYTFVKDGNGGFGCIVPSGSCMGDCGSSPRKWRFRTMEFLRYTEIATILGIGRDGLPPLFRDYLSHVFVPYHGNSILDNVKPEYTAIEHDYVSRRNTNRMEFTFKFCGNCVRKLFKQYKVADEAVVVISSKRGCVIEVIPMDEYTEKYTK